MSQSCKTCPHCRTEKQLEHFARDRTHSDGRATVCKDCRREYKKSYRKRPASKLKIRTDIRYHSLRKIYRERHGRSASRAELEAFSLQLRTEKRIARDLARRNQERQSLLNTLKAFLKVASKQERILAGAKLCKLCGTWKPKRFFWLDPSKLDGHANTCSQCKAASDRNGIARRARSRAAKLGVQESITTDQVEEIMARFDWRCFRCGSQDALNLDHHYPIRSKIPLSDSNAVLLCRSCNSAKGQRQPEAFYSKEELSVLHRKYLIRQKNA